VNKRILLLTFAPAFVFALLSIFPQAVFAEKYAAAVEPVFGPSENLVERIADLVERASRAVYVGQYLFPREINGRKNRMLDAIESKAAAGVEVLILLDRNDDNYETAKYLKSEGSRAKVRFYGSEDSRYSRFHSKWLVVDNETVFVSSINWNVGSLFRNREVGVVMEGEAALAYASAFFSDWEKAQEMKEIKETKETKERGGRGGVGGGDSGVGGRGAGGGGGGGGRGSGRGMVSTESTEGTWGGEKMEGAGYLYYYLYYLFYIGPPLAGLALFLAARHLFYVKERSTEGPRTKRTRRQGNGDETVEAG